MYSRTDKRIKILLICIVAIFIISIIIILSFKLFLTISQFLNLLPRPFQTARAFVNLHFKVIISFIAPTLFYCFGLSIILFCFFFYKKLENTCEILTNNMAVEHNSTKISTHLPYLLLIAAVCVISSLIYPFFWENGIDQFFYLGFQLHFLEYYGEIFQNTYYGTRLGVVLPGFIVYSLLSPAFAHLTLIWFKLALGAFSLYAFIVRFRGHLSALLISILFSLWPWVTRTSSSFYLDGFGIAYYLLTCALIIQALHSCFPQRWLFAAGISAALLFSTNVFCFIYLIPLFLFFLFDGSKKDYRQFTQQLAFFITWTGLGFLALLFIFGIISIAFGGYFLFFSPSLFQILSLSGGNPWAPKDLSWLITAKHLSLQFFTLIISITGLSIYLFHRKRSKENWTLAQTSCLVFITSFLLHCLYGNKLLTLQLHYYSSYLLGISFIVLGCLIQIEKKQTTLLAFGIVVLALLVSWFFHYKLYMPGTTVFLGLSLLGLLLTFLCAGLFAWPIKQGAIIMTLYLCWAAFYAGHYNMPQQLLQGKTEFELMIDAHYYIWNNCDNKTVKFWHDNNTNISMYTSLSSLYLWGNRLMGMSFPELTDRKNQPIKFPNPGDDFVIMSTHKGVIETIKSIFAEQGISATLKTKRNFNEHGKEFTIYIFNTLDLSTVEVD